MVFQKSQCSTFLVFYVLYFFRKRTRKRKKRNQNEEIGTKIEIKKESVTETETKRRRENERGNEKERGRGNVKNENAERKTGIETETVMNATETVIVIEIGIVRRYEIRIGIPSETERRSVITMKMKRWTGGGGSENREKKMPLIKRYHKFGVVVFWFVNNFFVKLFSQPHLCPDFEFIEIVLTAQ